MASASPPRKRTFGPSIYECTSYLRTKPTMSLTAFMVWAAMTCARAAASESTESIWGPAGSPDDNGFRKEAGRWAINVCQEPNEENEDVSAATGQTHYCLKWLGRSSF